MSLPKVMNARDVAELLKVSVPHAYALMKRMTHSKIGSSIRVTEDDFNIWFAETKKAGVCDFTSAGPFGGPPSQRRVRQSVGAQGRQPSPLPSSSQPDGRSSVRIRLQRRLERQLLKTQ